MAIKALFHIDDISINVISCSYKFIKNIDYTGRPISAGRYIGLKLVIESQKDYDFTLWSTSNSLMKQIALHFVTHFMDGKTRKVKFIDSELVEHTTQYTHNTKEPLTETFFITSAGVEDSNSAGIYSAHWRVTFPNKAPITRREHLEPAFLGYHFENKHGETIDEKKIRTHQKIYLVIKTENALGKTMQIDLNNTRLDFIYKDRVLENDILKGVSIDGDETRIPLKAVKE